MLDSPAMAEKAHAIVKRLPEDVGWLCEPLLEVEPGRRLLALNPALAVAMSLRAGTGENWQRRLDEYLALRARDLAGRLGFGGTRRALRTLAKLEPESVTVPVLRLLTLLLEDDREKWLFHLPALNTASIEILAVPRRRGIVTFAFLVELCRDLDAAMCDMIVVTLDDIRIQRLSLTPERVHARIDSFQALMAEDDDLWDRGVRRQLFLPLPFHPSPELQVPQELRGRLRFEPLRDMAAVCAHGERQGNCLARGGEVEVDLILGRRFLYRLVARPSGAEEELEATLAVAQTGVGLCVSELRVTGNHPAPGWLVEAVAHVVGRWRPSTTSAAWSSGPTPAIPSAPYRADTTSTSPRTNTWSTLLVTPARPL